MSSKWVELLKESVPQIARVAMIFNPETAPGHGDYFLQPFEKAAATLGLESLAVPLKDTGDIEPAIASIAHEPNRGLAVMSDIFTSVNNKMIVQAVEKHRLPAVYPFRFFVTNGGLISYGPDTTDIFRRSAAYVDRILKGASPADLPVQEPIKFEFIVNLKTAQSFGLTMPSGVLSIADEVIE